MEQHYLWEIAFRSCSGCRFWSWGYDLEHLSLLKCWRFGQLNWCHSNIRCCYQQSKRFGTFWRLRECLRFCLSPRVFIPLLASFQSSLLFLLCSSSWWTLIGRSLHWTESFQATRLSQSCLSCRRLRSCFYERQWCTSKSWESEYTAWSSQKFYCG